MAKTATKELVKETLEASEALIDVQNEQVDTKLLTAQEKPFYGFPRASWCNRVSRPSVKKSYTDKSQYIPLAESVKNLLSGKSIRGSSSVNLVSAKDYDFVNGERPPMDYRANDGLLSMDIADVAQKQRDMQNQLDKLEKEVKNLDDRASIEAIRRLVKDKKAVSKDLYAGLDDGIKSMLDSYNSTIQ